jgi:SOS-response transcriptional repressor LexA
MEPRAKLLGALKAYWDEHGYSPSYDELSAITDIPKSTVVYHVNVLALQGRIRRQFGKQRTLVIVNDEES